MRTKIITLARCLAIAVIAAAALTTVLGLLQTDVAEARWGWCKSDPKFDVTARNILGQTVKAQVIVEPQFDAAFIERIDKTKGVVVTIWLPANVNATVDPASLVPVVDGVAKPGLFPITGVVKKTTQRWNGLTALPIKSQAVVHVQRGAEPFPVEVYFSHNDGLGFANDYYVSGRAGQTQSRTIYVQPGTLLALLPDLIGP